MDEVKNWLQQEYTQGIEEMRINCIEKFVQRTGGLPNELTC